MPYLTLDLEQIHLAWEASRHSEHVLSEPVLAVEEQLRYGRRAVVVHVPQSWPHRIVCHNCGHAFPCRIALWGMALLRAQGWDLSGVIDLIERVQAGEQRL